MSKPITDPRREPPLHYVCAQCGESSEDFAGLITEDAHRGYGELGEWECGCCGGQEWRTGVAEAKGREGREGGEMSERILTCVYCGHEYPQSTPTWNDKILTDHIRECPRHPMRQAEQTIATLRDALAGIIGTSDPIELKQMELALRIMPGLESDRTASLNAIHALLALAADDEAEQAAKAWKGNEE